MRLADIVAMSISDRQAPAAALAITYAERIDECGHVGLALSAALDQLRLAAQLADEADCAADDANVRAYRKVAAALSAVTVTSELGPKLLAALDALLLTPKAKAAVGQALPAASTASPLGALRAEEDELTRRRRARAG